MVVVIDHARGLHEGIANGRAHEFEAPADQVFAHGIGFGCPRGWMCAILATLRIAIRGELPDVSVEAAEFLLHSEKGLGIDDGGPDLQAIAHDAGIGQQSSYSRRPVASDASSIEAIEGAAIIFALIENGGPAKSRLRAFQNEQLEQLTVVMQRHTPLAIVVGDVRR